MLGCSHDAFGSPRPADNRLSSPKLLPLDLSTLKSWPNRVLDVLLIVAVAGFNHRIGRGMGCRWPKTF